MQGEEIMRYQPRHLTEAYLGELELHRKNTMATDHMERLAQQIAEQGKFAINTTVAALNEHAHIVHVWALFLIGREDEACAPKIAEAFAGWMSSQQDPSFTILTGMVQCIVDFAIPLVDKIGILLRFEYEHPDYVECAVAEALGSLISNDSAEYQSFLADIEAFLNRDTDAPVDLVLLNRSIVAIHVLSHLDAYLTEDVIPLLKRCTEEHPNWAARFFSLIALFNKGLIDCVYLIDRLGKEPEFAGRLNIASTLAQQESSPIDPLLYVPPILEMMPTVSSETYLDNATFLLAVPHNAGALAFAIQNKQFEMPVRQIAVQILYQICIALREDRNREEAALFFREISGYTSFFVDALAWSEGETSQQLTTLITEGGVFDKLDRVS
jgi:hypothetical protein